MKLFDRDLSWLSFNYRVLMEAMDENVPLLERLKFVAIYSSNLDEFFRVRVANIRNLVKMDKKKINKQIEFEPKELLKKIHKEVEGQLEVYGKTFRKIIEELKKKGIFICTSLSEIPSDFKLELLHFFKTRVLGRLAIIDTSKTKKLFLNNQAIYHAIRFKSGHIKIINIPSDILGRFFQKRHESSTYFIFLDDIIRLHLDIVFPNQEVEECLAIKLNKDADLQIDDEYEGNLIKKIEKQIQKRNLGAPSRFLFDAKMSSKLRKLLTGKLNLRPDDNTPGGRYHNLNDLFEITTADTSLAYPSLPPIIVKELQASRSILKKIEEKEILLHFPYHSYDYILQFFNEAAIDPKVEEINVTFYRMAKKSIIGEALINAAKNGKRVAVFMEVKARFDEKNNLEWAERLKEAGAKIIFSLPGLKVHAKVALVKKKNIMYGFFGTGNLNEKTSETYTDLGLLSTNVAITQELSYVFLHLLTRYTPPEFNHLIVSQFGAFERFSSLIDREIRHAEAGKEANIIVKVNNLQERELIGKLYECSNKGVDLKLIVRSICCMVPKKPIKIKRIVDRYLEHARVFYFFNDGQPEMYLGSADWMNRNLHRRIEVCFPIYDDNMKDDILTLLKFQWQDDQKGVWINTKMANKRAKKEYQIRAQMATYQFLKDQYG
ncbi:MAG: polyphosphate kinase 1 [Bacteroidota bacterium]